MTGRKQMHTDEVEELHEISTEIKSKQMTRTRHKPLGTTMSANTTVGAMYWSNAWNNQQTEYQ